MIKFIKRSPPDPVSDRRSTISDQSEMVGNGRKWSEWSETVGNGWKRSEMLNVVISLFFFAENDCTCLLIDFIGT